MSPSPPPAPPSHEQRRTYGAGIAAGALASLLLGAGPLVAVAAGLSAAYAASVEPPGSAAGDAARALGEAAVRLQEYDKEHRIVDRTRDAAIVAMKAAAGYVHEHKLVERSAVAAGKVAYWVAEQVSEQILANRAHRQIKG